MTEADLRKHPEFWGQLPIYNIAEVHDLDRPDDPSYEPTITQVRDEAEFDRLLKDPAYDLKGAIRDAEGVRTVFWKKRPSPK